MHGQLQINRELTDDFVYYFGPTFSGTSTAGMMIHKTGQNAG